LLIKRCWKKIKKWFAKKENQHSKSLKKAITKKREEFQFPKHQEKSSSKLKKCLDFFFEKFNSPSVINACTILIFVLLVYAILALLNQPIKFLCNYLSFFLPFNIFGSQQILSIQIGLIATVFAYFIFLAQMAEKKNNQDEKRVIIETTNFFPLVNLTLFLLLITILRFENIINSLLSIVVLIYLLISIIKATRFITDERYAYQKYSEFLKNRIKFYSKLLIEERIGSDLLYKMLENNKINFTSLELAPQNLSNYYYLKAPKTGLITDINLNKLKEFIDSVDKYGREKGFYYCPEKKT
jgi:hypothetical protein